jgi:hypothetical protein
VIDRPAEVQLRSFIAEARFTNPIAAKLHSFDYGLLFSVEPDFARYYFLVVDSDQRWSLNLSTQDSADSIPIAGGIEPQLDMSLNGSNRLRLIVEGGTAYIYLNDKFITSVENLEPAAGDVAVATGIFSGDMISGGSTPYADFSVWSLP